jgi:hypothetical protein
VIKLLFTAANDAISGTIRALDASDVSHVGIQVGVDKVISAEASGVREHSLFSFMSGGRRLVAVYEATEEGEKHLLVWRVRNLIGSKYGFRELPGLAWSMLNRWLGREVKNKTRHAKTFFCSELVLYLDDETGFVTEFVGLDPSATPPGVLLTRLRLGGPTFRCVF